MKKKKFFFNKIFKKFFFKILNIKSKILLLLLLLYIYIYLFIVHYS